MERKREMEGGENKRNKDIDEKVGKANEKGEKEVI